MTQGLAEARQAVRQAATVQGWTVDERQSTPDVLVVKKGMTAFSWGSELRVALEPTDQGTRVAVHTAESFAVTDWGRGKRAAIRLLVVLGARID
jgi:hypothetical protein